MRQKLKYRANGKSQNKFKDQWPCQNKYPYVNSKSGKYRAFSVSHHNYKDKEAICLFKINIDSQNLEYWCIRNIYMKIIIRIAKANQEPPASLNFSKRLWIFIPFLLRQEILMDFFENVMLLIKSAFPWHMIAKVLSKGKGNLWFWYQYLLHC